MGGNVGEHVYINQKILTEMKIPFLLRTITNLSIHHILQDISVCNHVPKHKGFYNVLQEYVCTTWQPVAKEAKQSHHHLCSHL